MRELSTELGTWLEAGKRIAIATVVEVWGSAPRPIGSKMAISDAGDIAGSVSGGCVEGAVYEEAQEVLARGTPKLVGYGVSQEDAWAVGLSCGGKIEVFIELLESPVASSGSSTPGSEITRSIRRFLDDDQLFARGTVIAGPGIGDQILVPASPDALRGSTPGGSTLGGLGNPDLDARVADRSRELFRSFASERMSVPLPDGSTAELFLEVFPPRPRLIIVGAVHAAIPLVGFANTLGFRTILVDPRTAFATAERFPHADELITDWPDEALERLAPGENTYLVLLSHDQKLDLPALRVALPSPIRYIGALGSKKTHAKRIAALREEGVAEELIARIHNPIGLDLGGRRAEEMAVAIIAQMVAVRHGRDLR